jgi:lipoprotein-anchoring transpeptidase ErfK/SrfK
VNVARFPAVAAVAAAWLLTANHITAVQRAANPVPRAAPAPQTAAPDATSPATPGTATAVAPLTLRQIRLSRAGFSPGEIDGTDGANTRRAIDAYRRAFHLDAGDEALDAALAKDTADPTVTYAITDQDVAGPFLPSIPSDLTAQAELPALSYTSVLELIAERAHASPALVRAWNPSATFSAGETLRLPNAQAASPPAGPAARIVVTRAASGLTAYDASDRVIFFAPVTSGSEHDPLPIGKWTVTAIVHNPTFNYNPDLFWDAAPGHGKAKLPAGPNGPVGTVWIDISKPHYGLHGTPEPSKIGHTMSHGCVRLTNWDAETVARLVQKGTPVLFEP